MSDETLNHPAVLLYRQTFRLCPSVGWRKDIAVTVTNLELFKNVLIEWKRRKWNPMRIGWLLDEYERLNGKAK